MSRVPYRFDLTAIVWGKVEAAVETRMVDKELLVHVAAARIIVAVARRVVDHIKIRSSTVLEQRIKTHYSGHIFEAYARLDLPTFEDPLVRRQLETAAGGRTAVAWNTVQVVANSISTVILLASQLAVLFDILGDQRDGRLIVLMSFISPVLQWLRWSGIRNQGGTWILYYKTPN